MDFIDLKRLKSSTQVNFQEDQKFEDFSRKRSEGHNQGTTKNVLIIYASGSMGANKQLQIQRGGLKKLISTNFYLCDLEHTKRCDNKLQYLITPIQQNGVRIRYKIQQLQKIDGSINMTMKNIGQIASLIYQYYNDCHAFLVVTGLDTICHVGTVLSFMLENLSKLVICTGGYLPLSKMRNDSVSNLVQCFSVIAEASSINDVLIVSKNKGFRANRCIKMTQGDFENIQSPNLPALCSIKTKLRVRSYLFQPQPTGQFTIWTQMSNKVKVLRLNNYECFQSLEYELKNPYIKGYVIKSYSFADIPNSPELLRLFKQAYEDESRKTIFINISEAIYSKNQSLMKSHLEQYHINFGSDMTLQAALSKLSYLIGRGYTEEHIIKLMQTNMRGQLTQQKQKLQWKIKQIGTLQIVNEILSDYFPTTLKTVFYSQIQNDVAQYILNKCTSQEFKQIFWNTNCSDKQNFKKTAQRVNMHNLLHKAVEASNLVMAEFFIETGADLNREDQNSCSPLYYAIKNQDKSMIQLLSKNGARVICQMQDLFQIFIQAIKKDDVQFFNLLYHIEFKETMKNIKNQQLRSVAHIAGLLKSFKCFKLMKQKFNILVTEQDIYGYTAYNYIQNTHKKEISLT